MKLFRLMGTMTIVAAVAASMAVSASALEASYSAGTVTVSDVATADGDYTVVVTSALEGVNPAEGDIFQIDQTETKPETIAVPTLNYGAYYVRVGGYEDGYDNARFAVSPDPVEAQKVGTYADSTEDDAATAYVVSNTPAYNGLIPYWAATDKQDVKAFDNWANVTGNVSLGLVVQGVDLEGVSLIWK